MYLFFLFFLLLFLVCVVHTDSPMSALDWLADLWRRLWNAAEKWISFLNGT